MNAAVIFSGCLKSNCIVNMCSFVRWIVLDGGVRLLVVHRRVSRHLPQEQAADAAVPWRHVRRLLLRHVVVRHRCRYSPLHMLPMLVFLLKNSLYVPITVRKGADAERTPAVSRYDSFILTVSDRYTENWPTSWKSKWLMDSTFNSDTVRIPTLCFTLVFI